MHERRFAHGALAAIAIAAAAAAAMTGEPSGRTDPFIDAVTLARRIAAGDAPLIIDLRSQEAYDALHVTSAVRMPVTLGDTRDVVLYSDDDDAALLVQTLHPHAVVLRGGISEWVMRILEPKIAAGATESEEEAFEEAATLSRYFGGTPQRGVDVDDVPAGFWARWYRPTGGDANARVAGMRRRGC